MHRKVTIHEKYKLEGKLNQFSPSYDRINRANTIRPGKYNCQFEPELTNDQKKSKLETKRAYNRKAQKKYRTKKRENTLNNTFTK